MKNFLISLLLIFAVSCKSSQTSNQESTNLVFESVKHAQGFSISKDQKGSTLSLFHPFTDQKDTLQFYFTRGKYKHEKGLIPLKKILITSTTHVGFLEEIGALDQIIGIVGAKYVYSEQVRSKIKNVRKSKHINVVKRDDLEAIIALKPDVVLVSGMSQNDFVKYKKLEQFDIMVIPISEWLETSPLGKAEWIKVFALLTGKDDKGKGIFLDIQNRYDALLDKVSIIKNKKKVITGLPYQGVWHVPGGKSYVSQFFKDAGVIYPWENSLETGSITPSFESIFLKAKEADVWLAPGNTSELAKVKATDDRFSTLKVLKDGSVYNHNKRLSPQGGDDYWESGVVHPDVVLADLIKIFYPALLPDHNLYYYHKLQ